MFRSTPAPRSVQRSCISPFGYRAGRVRQIRDGTRSFAVRLPNVEMQLFCARRGACVLLNISAKFWRISRPACREVGYRAGRNSTAIQSIVPAANPTKTVDSSPRRDAPANASERCARRRRASTRARDDDGGATSARERRDERAGRDGRRGGAYMPAALRSSSIFFAAAARRAWISFSSAAFFARSSSGESVFSAEPS